MIHVRNYVVNGLESSPHLIKILKLILKLSRERYFGNINLQFSDGQIVLVKKEEVFKPGNINIVE
jgi:hypothetical protein